MMELIQSYQLSLDHLFQDFSNQHPVITFLSLFILVPSFSICALFAIAFVPALIFSILF